MSKICFVDINENNNISPFAIDAEKIHGIQNQMIKTQTIFITPNVQIANGQFRNS